MLWATKDFNHEMKFCNLLKRVSFKCPLIDMNPVLADDEDSSSNSSQSSTAKILAALSNAEIAFEWSMLCQECVDCWSGNGEYIPTSLMR